MSSIYTIVSDRGMMLDKKINEILSSIKGEYDLVDIDMDEDSIITLLSELKTLPFLSDYRVIRLTNPKVLYNSNNIDSRLIEEFIAFLSNPIDTTVLITVISPSEFSKIKKDAKDLSKKLFDELTSKGSLYTLGGVSSNDIDDIIKEELKDYKVEVRAIEELKTRVLADPTRIISEISKLKLYKYDEKTISAADVDLLVSRDLEDKVYLLTQSILSKARKEALGLYSDFKKSGIMDSLILASIINKFQELYIVKVMVTSGYDKDMVAEAFHVKSGRAYYMIQDASRIKLNDIKDKYEELLLIDYRVKSGLSDKSNALWLYLLDV